MSRKGFGIVLALVLILLLTGCGCDHEWLAATCTAPKTCQLCGETEGELGGHTWQEATCTAPKTCSVCELTEGEPAAHTWQEATTEAPETCSSCNQTQGSKLETDSRFTTKATKELHGVWTCDVTLTQKMLGLEGFDKGVDCALTMEFGKTGELTSSFKLSDEEAFMADFRQYTIDTTYAPFIQQGMSKDQVDQAMLSTTGLTVEGYVDAILKSFDMNTIFQAFNAQEVYYVADGAIYTALTWDAKFEKSGYTLKNGVLTVEGLALEAGGAPLQWKKA